MRKLVTLGSSMLAAALTAGLLAAPAVAEPLHPIIYLGVAGGSKVTAADGTVTSDLTAETALQGYVTPASSQNATAHGGVTGLLTTGAIQTSEAADADGGVTTITSNARTERANLLSGLLTAKAVVSTASAKFDGSSVTAATGTQFVGIKIANVDLPVNIPQNFGVHLPGVADIVLNYASTYQDGGALQTFGAAAYIRLLADSGSNPLGTEVFLNPTYAAIAAHVPNTPVLLGGSAYATKLNVNALGVIKVGSGPTAYQGLSIGGTNGDVQTNSVAGVSIPDVLTSGAVSTTVQGSRTNKTGNARTTAAVAGLNILGGLVKAKAIKASAQVTLARNGDITVNQSSRLVGLVIAGQRYPISVAPNTQFDVAGLGTVTLNQQYGYSFSANVRAINIKLSTAQAGLPVGATIEIGFASAYIIS